MKNVGSLSGLPRQRRQDEPRCFRRISPDTVLRSPLSNLYGLSFSGDLGELMSEGLPIRAALGRRTVSD
jgi:hypothetical protein